MEESKRIAELFEQLRTLKPQRTPSPTERQAPRRSARLAGRHPDNNKEVKSTSESGQTSRPRGRAKPPPPSPAPAPVPAPFLGRDRSEYEGKPHKDLAYCTQKCLLGLVKGDVLDPDCPNFKLHQQHRDSNSNNNNRGRATKLDSNSHHPINHDEFLQLLSRQLKCTLDFGITSLDITGARGALFKVTLLAYGYTFISKGTVAHFIPFLRYEARVYARLGEVQGVHVPVFLGAVDLLGSLGRTYYYDFDVDVVYLCFMSWAGLDLRAQVAGKGPGRKVKDKDKSALQRSALAAMQAIHQCGVVHKDARCENMLFNPQTGGVMVIDFERALLPPDPPRPTLAAVEPNELEANKRRGARDSEARAESKPANRSGDFAADIAGVERAFYSL